MRNNYSKQPLILSLLLVSGIMLTAGIITYATIAAPESASLLFSLFGILSKNLNLKTNHTDLSPTPPSVYFVLGPRHANVHSGGVYPLTNFVTLAWAGQARARLTLGAINKSADYPISYFFRPKNESLLPILHVEGTAAELYETLEPIDIILCPASTNKQPEKLLLSGSLNFSSGIVYNPTQLPVLLTKADRLALPAQIDCITPCPINQLFNSTETARRSFQFTGVTAKLNTTATLPTVTVNMQSYDYIYLNVNQANAGLWELGWQHVCNFTQKLIINSVTAQFKLKLAAITSHHIPQLMIRSLQLIVHHPNNTYAKNLKYHYSIFAPITAEFSLMNNIYWVVEHANFSYPFNLSRDNQTLSITAPANSINSFMKKHVQVISTQQNRYFLTTQLLFPNFVGRTQQCWKINSFISQKKSMFSNQKILNLSALWLFCALAIIVVKKISVPLANRIDRYLPAEPPRIQRVLDFFIPPRIVYQALPSAWLDANAEAPIEVEMAPLH